MAEAGGEHVELVYRATVGDFREALRVAARASAAGRWGRGLLFFAAGTGALVTTVSLALGGTPGAQALVGLGAAVVGLVVLPRAQARRLHRRAAARGEHRTVLDLWGVTTTTDRGAPRMSRWSEITRYAETRGTFVLLDGHPYAPAPLPLPKRVTGDVDALRALLDRRLSRPRSG
ncbi:YcxB family protein [Streptomyces sp. HM190]|uniref:YcxB family protein n=1 Tax=Streptomyces sp. HM190 TaxID=2695266 RepID=UPI0013569627|nr:YcxB family protein [Streptomyces sp. HM190]